MALYRLTEVDRRVYETRIADFLPDRLIDVHAHVWRDADKAHAPDEHGRTVRWPSRVARECPMEDLEETYRLMFPGKEVRPLVFSNAAPGDDLEALNSYVAASARERAYPALLFAHPSWSGPEVERRIRAAGFLGVKVYLSLAPPYLPRAEIRIFDFLPPHQLDELHANRRVVMLHIPRDGRLRDPVNLEQLLEIERAWPGVRLVVAHVGRAYCDQDVGNAFTRLASTRSMVFDFAANTNARVFEQALRVFGPERCLFGSDLPITVMRMRRVTEGGTYVNLVPRGLYGDVSGDPNMRAVDPPESDGLTTFLYEEILAIREACERVGIGRAGIDAIFRTSAERVLGLTNALGKT